MKHTQNENAVSPVIGVILMVAITVVLAATIAAFVFGMAGSIQHAKIVAVTVNQPATDQIVVTYMGGQDASQFDHATVNISADDKYNKYLDVDNLTSTVGNSVVATAENGMNLQGANHVVVVGHFTDGSAQVLIDTYV